jgi:decaprenylphospho-beta-D-ribofuranose 2-oxidase
VRVQIPIQSGRPGSNVAVRRGRSGRLARDLRQRDGVDSAISIENEIQSFDVEAGIVVAQAGVTIRQLLAASLPFGWIPPVLPENTRTTVAAAVAGDVHGRNHAGAGSIGHHIHWLELQTSGGETLRLSRKQDAQAFWATIGGLGLTGRVIQVALELQPISTAYVRRTQIRTDSLEQTLELFDEVAVRQWSDPTLHVIARLDGVAGGRPFGPGVVETIAPAELDELPFGWGKTGLRMPSGADLRSVRSLSRKSVGLARAAISEVTFRAQSATQSSAQRTSICHLANVLFQDDGGRVRPQVLTGSGGIRYEFAVPENNGWLLGHVLRMLQRGQLTPTAVAIRRFGVGNMAALSFPRPGWSMSLELPAGSAQLAPAMDTADRMMVRYGGRVRLVDDSRLSPNLLTSMYPRVESWRAVRDRLDPDREISTALGRRLELV